MKTIWILQGYYGAKTFWFNKPTLEQLVKTGLTESIAKELLNSPSNTFMIHHWSLKEVEEGKLI